MSAAQDFMNECTALEIEIIKLKETNRDLLGALHDLEVSANTVAGCYSRNPGRFTEALEGLGEYAEAARAVINKVERAPS